MFHRAHTGAEDSGKHEEKEEVWWAKEHEPGLYKTEQVLSVRLLRAFSGTWRTVAGNTASQELRCFFTDWTVGGLLSNVALGTETGR